MSTTSRSTLYTVSTNNISTPSNCYTISVKIVGGGGGGSGGSRSEKSWVPGSETRSHVGGGGGAGGYIYVELHGRNIPTSYSVTVGPGGSGGAGDYQGANQATGQAGSSGYHSGFAGGNNRVLLVANGGKGGTESKSDHMGGDNWDGGAGSGGSINNTSLVDAESSLVAQAGASGNGQSRGVSAWSGYGSGGTGGNNAPGSGYSGQAGAVEVIEYYTVPDTVSFTVNNGGYGSVSPTSLTNVPHGSSITVSGNKVTIDGRTVTATPAATTAQYTYAFSSWSNASGTITAPRTITANFSRTLRSYVVTLSTEGKGTVTGAGTYSYGTDVTITATPATGYKFVRWSDGDTNASRVINVTGTVTLTAQFVLIAPLQIKASGAWVDGVTYVKYNDQWVLAKKIFIKENDQWHESK